MYLLLFAFCELSGKTCDLEFHKFKLSYRKKYQGAEEAAARAAFCFNLEQMEALKRQNPGLQLKVNALFDLRRLPVNAKTEERDSAAERKAVENVQNRKAQIPISANFLERKRADEDSAEVKAEKELASYNRDPAKLREVELWCRGQSASGMTGTISILKEGAEMVLQGDGNFTSKNGTNVTVTDFLIALNQKVPIRQTEAEAAGGVFRGNQTSFSVDLREWGTAIKTQDQGTCGSCYQFANRVSYTSTFLHDLQIYKNLKYGLRKVENKTGEFDFNQQVSEDYTSVMQKMNSGNTRLSVQYQLNNSFSIQGNQYCSGGNFAPSAQDMAYFNAEGIELERNIPYSALGEADDVVYTEETRPKASNITSKEFATSLIRPFYSFYNSVGEACPKNTIGYRIIENRIFPNQTITLKSEQKSVKITADRLLMLLLNLGVAVVGRMGLDQSTLTESDSLKFQMYSGGIVEGNCKDFTSNHQVTFVGYGHYKGTPVWVLQNSWGQSWGIDGYYYIKRGQNAFCHEMDFQAMLPQYLMYEGLENSAVQFNSTQLFKDAVENKTLFNVFNQSLKRGYDGLDLYDEDGNVLQLEKYLGNGKWAIAVIGFLLIAVWLYQFIRCACCQVSQILRPVIYLNMKEPELQKYNWENIENVEVDFEINLEGADNQDDGEDDD